MKLIIKILLKYIPRKYLIRFSFAFSGLFSLFYVGKKHHCPVCGGHFRTFLPYGYSDEKAENRLCPRCLSLERHRLIWLYLKNETSFFSEPLKMLHIAPEQSFYTRFKKIKTLIYHTGDLESPLAQFHFDIHQMPFGDNTYDMVMCNHVLEHVADEPKAGREILRVLKLLKPGGQAILQVPINENFEKTFEDPSITEPKDRTKYFGQYDHVRWHGKDYAQRLRSYGFDVKEVQYTDQFTAEDIEKMRLTREKVIFVATKP